MTIQSVSHISIQQLQSEGQGTLADTVQQIAYSQPLLGDLGQQRVCVCVCVGSRLTAHGRESRWQHGQGGPVLFLLIGVINISRVGIKKKRTFRAIDLLSLCTRYALCLFDENRRFVLHSFFYSFHSDCNCQDFHSDKIKI